jgi:hypothetical protein
MSIITIAIHLVSLANLSSWMVIGLVGMLLIVGASFYERFGLSFLTKS